MQSDLNDVTLTRGSDGDVFYCEIRVGKILVGEVRVVDNVPTLTLWRRGEFGDVKMDAARMAKAVQSAIDAVR